jgi:hypothetical protein
LSAEDFGPTPCGLALGPVAGVGLNDGVVQFAACARDASIHDSDGNEVQERE